jgi:acyl carrier protein
MLERNQVRDAVFRAMERVNALSLDERAFPAGESTVLFGEGAFLDSMGFVNLVVAVEEEIGLISDQPLNLREVLNLPEISIGDLIDFLSQSLQPSTLS